MKLVFVFDGLGIGGIERVGINYLKLLSKNNEIVVVNLKPNLKDMENEIPNEIKIINIHYPRNITPSRYEVLKKRGIIGSIFYIIIFIITCLINIIYNTICRKKIKELKNIDIAIAFSGHYNDLTFVIKNFKNSAKKTIAWLHGSEYSYYQISPAFLKLYKKIKNLVCLSEKDDTEIEDYNKKNKIKKIKLYNPICLDDRVIDQKKVDEIKNRYDDFILMVGRLSKDKDQATLIRSMSILKNKYKLNKKLLLVGDGPQRSFLETLVTSLDLAENVIFCGAHDDVQNYYSAATVYAHSSPAEGLPTVLLEAMFYHLPIASTNSEPGVREILQNNCGLISDVGDSEELAKNIYSLYTDKELCDKLISSCQVRLKKFMPEYIIDKLDVFMKENL